MFKSGHVIVKYVKMRKEDKDKFPQCKCGALARKHYEILEATINLKEPSIANIICANCFEKMIGKFLE